MSDLEKLKAALKDRYELERELGAGGMATVYLAQDIKHDRKVAVKVLKPELAAVLGAERFVQEIKTTANLQHPHILPLFDSGEAKGFLYYVMPFIDGETIRDKLNRETQLGVEEALKITAEIADALDYAHRNNVIHRDIKPENILIHDGRPMVADFGIALAVSAAAGGRMTETGMSLGTPHYMSPEQATADKELTNRSDIYSLGSVLYEMLTGDPPHTGSSAQQVIMKIVTDEAESVRHHRKSVPQNVAAAVAKSLQKLAADRFGTAKDFAAALTDPDFGFQQTGKAAFEFGGAASGWKRLSLASLAIASFFAVAFLWVLNRPEAELPVSRYSVTIEDGNRLSWGSGIAISNDGYQLIYPTADASGRTAFWVKERDQIRARMIPGTQDGVAPSFSPDGRHLAFAWRSAVVSARRVSLDGTPPLTVSDSGMGSDGMSWGYDGFIYLDGLTLGGTTGIARVQESGGFQENVTTIDTAAGEVDHIWPHALPNGRGVLFTIMKRGPSIEEAEIAVVDLDTKEHKILIRGLIPHFVPPNFLIFLHADGVLRAVKFDQDRLEIHGDPVAMVEGVSLPAFGGITVGGVNIGVSHTGTLVYGTRDREGEGLFELITIGRDGTIEDLDVDAMAGANRDFSLLEGSVLRVSPDGRRLAFVKPSSEGSQLWMMDLPDGVPSKFTFEGRNNVEPYWSPDGEYVVFVSDRGGVRSFYRKRADGSAAPELFVDLNLPVHTGVLSPDGEWLIYGPLAGAFDIHGIRPGQDTVPIRLLDSDASELGPQISPNGEWLAYISSEQGGNEVFIRPFPDVETTRYQISTNGASNVFWSRSGREIFFVSNDFRLYAVSLDFLPGGRVAVREPELLFSIPGGVAIDVLPGDQNFIVLRYRTDGISGRLIVVENWVEELRQRFETN